eukprot:s1160_g11.t1
MQALYPEMVRAWDLARRFRLELTGLQDKARSLPGKVSLEELLKSWDLGLLFYKCRVLAVVAAAIVIAVVVLVVVLVAEGSVAVGSVHGATYRQEHGCRFWAQRNPEEDAVAVRAWWFHCLHFGSPGLRSCHLQTKPSDRTESLTCSDGWQLSGQHEASGRTGPGGAHSGPRDLPLRVRLQMFGWGPRQRRRVQGSVHVHRRMQGQVPTEAG